MRKGETEDEESEVNLWIKDVMAAMSAIAREHKASGARSGRITCPRCGGDLRWLKAKINGHVHAACETKVCLRWMQ